MDAYPTTDTLDTAPLVTFDNVTRRHFHKCANDNRMESDCTVLFEHGFVPQLPIRRVHDRTLHVSDCQQSWVRKCATAVVDHPRQE